MGKPYTTREAKKIIDMWTACEDVKAICKETGRSRDSVYSFIRRHRDNDDRFYDPRKTKRWSEEEEKTLEKMWVCGVEARKIAEKLGRTKGSVWERIKQIRKRHGEQRLPKRHS